MEHQPTQPLDPDMAAGFIRALTGTANSVVTFQTFADGDGDTSRPPGHFHAQLADAWASICDAQAQGHGVFVMVNEGDGRGRSGAHVVALRALFADADEGPVALDRLAQPSIVVASGHGEHYYWRLTRGESLASFTPAQKAIAAKLGTDRKVCDLARVMRLPGTYNLKDRSQPRLVRLVSAMDAPLRSTQEVLDALGASPTTSSRGRPRNAMLTEVSHAGVEDRARRYIGKIHAHQGEHGDDATFRAAAALVRNFALEPAVAWPLMVAWNQTNAHPAWSEKDLEEKFRNAVKYGTHQPGAALTANLPAAANEPMSVVSPEERVRMISSRCHRLTAALLEQDPPVKEFIWEGAIPMGDVGTLVGPGAAGKSATLVGLAVHMALGLPFLGRKTMCRPTVIVSLEDDLDDYRRKLAAWRDALGDRWDSRKVEEHVALLDLRGTDVRLVRAAGRDYASSVDARALAEVIKAASPDVGLVIMETVSRLGGDESNPAMSALVSAAEELSALTGAAIVLVAHVSKAAAREGKGDQHAARGGAAITDNGRFSITATLLDNDKGPDIRPLAARINEADRARMFVLRVAKVNCAPSSVIGIVERVGSRYQTVTVALRTAGDIAPVQPEDDVSRLLALRSLVERAARDGDVTKTTLTDRHGAELASIGITKRALNGVLKAAVAQGFLVPEPRQGKGGGMRLLAGTVPSVPRAA